MKLHTVGRFKVHDTPESMKKLAALVEEHEAPVVLEQDYGWWLSVKDLEEDFPEDFLRFLSAVGKELPGLLEGSIEVWWPYVIDSGPQKWEIQKDGKVFVYESDIQWGDPSVVECP